jgi:2-phosphoglycerate kinase
MSLALKKGILKCISTDTLRQVQRTCSTLPALHRSSYEGDDDPVTNWIESSRAVEPGLHSVVNDCLKRGVSLVLEGVHIMPSNDLIQLWSDGGGVAIGAVLSIENPDTHRDLIFIRGEITKKGAQSQIKDFARIRAIQNEMVRLATLNGWEIINEKMEDPYSTISEKIDRDNPAVPCTVHPLALRL